MQVSSALSEIVCGAGYVFDWEAISAIATTAAVILALWISVRDRRIRNMERLEAEARAAAIVAQSLAGLIEVMPRIIFKIKEMNGAMLDAPSNNVIYGIDDCRQLLAHEAFVHQLPTSYLGEGEFVVSLARKWCSEVETRIQIQKEKSLREAINWREYDFVCSLGDKFHASLISLRDNCRHTRHKYERSQKSLILQFLGHGSESNK